MSTKGVGKQGAIPVLNALGGRSLLPRQQQIFRLEDFIRLYVYFGLSTDRSGKSPSAGMSRRHGGGQWVS
jgi:hypothetical protein